MGEPQQKVTREITEAIAELSSAAWAYTALSVALELGIAEQLDEPSDAEAVAGMLDLDVELVSDLLGVLVALGALEVLADGAYRATPGFEPFRTGSMARVMRAAVRSDHLQTADAFERARSGSIGPGWTHLDPDLLISQGETAGLFRLVAEHVLPSLEGLGERLGSEDPRVLDVGSGVGVLSSELCRVYPALTSVCLEPNPAAREIGERRSRRAGYDTRVEFRPGKVEDLKEAAAYDLAMLPQPFLPRESFEVGLERVLSALRPGGWLMVVALDISEADQLEVAARRVRARLWGGGVIDAEEMTRLLERSGYESIRADAPVGAYRTFLARRGVAVPEPAPAPAAGATIGA